MVRIIKAAELLAETPAACPDGNFVDIRYEVQRQLQQARQQAARLVEEARQQARQICERAELQGREQGEAVLEARVGDEVQRRLATVLPALQQAIEAVQSARTSHLQACEGGIIRLAAAIAERLIRRELQHAPEIPLALVREALELAAGTRQIRIQLHPADYQTLAGSVADLARMQGDGLAIEVLADPGVSPGGCLVHTEFGVIDQRLEAQLARIVEELV